MSWFDLSEIGKIQLEISNYCNAECAGCDRDYIKKYRFSYICSIMNARSQKR